MDNTDGSIGHLQTRLHFPEGRIILPLQSEIGTLLGRTVLVRECSHDPLYTLCQPIDIKLLSTFPSHPSRLRMGCALECITVLPAGLPPRTVLSGTGGGRE